MRSRRNIQLKGLKRYSSGDVYYVYHRASGIRMPDHLPENHPDFIQAYLDATTRPPAKIRNGAGTIEALAHSFTAPQTFKLYAASYQALMRREYSKLIKKAGHVQFATIQERHILNDLAQMAPNAANKRRKAWRGLCKFALNSLREDDPSEGIKSITAPKIKGHIQWDQAEIQKFRKFYPLESKERLAFELLYWSAARMSDAVRLGEGMICDQGWLTFRQMKTKSVVSIAFRRDLPDFCDPNDLKLLKAAIDLSPSKHMTFINTSYDSSRSHKGASQWFSRAVQAVPIKGRTAHGLRKARAITLAENGATTHQIGAWTGHETLSEIENYSKAASKKRLLSGMEGEQKMSRNADL